VDHLSASLILAVSVAVILGFISVRRDEKVRIKEMIIFSLIFEALIIGLLCSADIFSFYIFFEAMLIPLFMLLGIWGVEKGNNAPFRFISYGLISSVLLFIAFISLYNLTGSTSLIESIKDTDLSVKTQVFILLAVILSFIARVPVWPFFNWMLSINQKLKSSLVYVTMILLPVTSIYGFARFSLNSISSAGEFFTPYILFIALVTIVGVSLVSLVNKDHSYKLFAYLSIYSSIYLIAIFIDPEEATIGLSNSLFGLIIIFSCLMICFRRMDIEKNKVGLDSLASILCYMPKLKIIFLTFTLLSLSAPFSPLFVGNFLLISLIAKYSLSICFVVIFSLIVISYNFLSINIFLCENCKCEEDTQISDISNQLFTFLIAVVILLLLSVAKPYWFMLSGVDKYVF